MCCTLTAQTKGLATSPYTNKPFWKLLTCTTDGRGDYGPQNRLQWDPAFKAKIAGTSSVPSMQQKMFLAESQAAVFIQSFSFLLVCSSTAALMWPIIMVSAVNRHPTIANFNQLPPKACRQGAWQADGEAQCWATV